MSVFNPFDQDTMPEPPPLEDEPVNKSRNVGKNSAHEQGLEIPMGWKPTIAEPVPVVRCKATSTTTGERCKRWSIRGTTVCQTHGGRLPNVVEHAEAVREAARLRLFGLADDAVEFLEELMQPGVADAVRLKAIENVLNRSGLKEAVEFKVEVTNNASPSEDIFKKLQIMRERVAPELEDLGEKEKEESDEEVS
jgi:hypothetical protein